MDDELEKKAGKGAKKGSKKLSKFDKEREVIEKFLEDIKDTAQWVQRTLDPKPDLIVSIARGGLVPGVYLSHLLEIENRPIVWQTRDSNKREGIPRECLGKDKLILIVDDINDT